MKKIIFTLLAAVVTLSASAQVIQIFKTVNGVTSNVETYTNTADSKYKAVLSNTALCPGNTQIWYTSSDGNVVWPKALNDSYKIVEVTTGSTAPFGVSILSNTYVNGKGVITCSGDIKYIADYAFKECTTLTSITIPESITEIRRDVFDGCTNLYAFNLPADMTNIRSLNNGDYTSPFTNVPAEICNSHVYLHCPETATSVSIPSTVTYIGQGAFHNCAHLTSIYIPGGVTTIGHYAFSQCTALTAITLPEGITQIPRYCVEGDTSIKEFILPSTCVSGYGEGVDKSLRGSSTSQIVIYKGDSKSLPSSDEVYVPGDAGTLYVYCLGNKDVKAINITFNDN